MDERKLSIVIGGIVAFFAICFLAFVVLRPRPNKSFVQKPTSTPKSPVSVSKPQVKSTYIPAPSGRSVDLRKEEEEARKRMEVLDEEMAKIGAEWLKKYINDTSISTVTREIYRLRNHPSVQSGYYFENSKDYSSAKEYYQKALEDPECTPTMKYFLFNRLISIAQKEKNPEDYFKWSKELGKLLAEADLSHIDQTKSDMYLQCVTEKEMFFKARDNPAMQEKLVEYLLRNWEQDKITPQIREKTLKDVKEQIKDIEKEIFG